MKHLIVTVAVTGVLIALSTNAGFTQTTRGTARNSPSSDVPKPEGRPSIAAQDLLQNQLLQSALATRSSSRSQDSVPPVIVGFGANDAAALETMEEDLAIMNRVLDRALERGLGEDAPATRLGVRLLYTSGSRSVRAMYLEGFGALFMIKVNFPLTRPASLEEKVVEKSADSEWESARRELLGREELDEMRALRSAAPAFEQGQVDGLKEVLMQALKDASHMRGLKPDEFVSISVFGPGSYDGKPRTRGAGSARQTQNRFPDADYGTKSAPDRIAQSLTRSAYRSLEGAGTVMSLRVKKADIDAFAAGKLNLDEFKSKLTTHSYVGNGHDVSSVNSWIHGGGAGLIYAPTR